MVGELEDAVVASTRICLERVKRATKKKKERQSIMTRPRFELGLTQMLHRSVRLIIVKLVTFLYL
jgi:hypothetical protein